MKITSCDTNEKSRNFCEMGLYDYRVQTAERLKLSDITGCCHFTWKQVE